MTSVIHGYCTLCRSRCGTLNTLGSDRLLSVEPDPSHPTGKAICMKGRAAPEIVHSPHRVFYPMRRTTPKGAESPKWKRISWEEALTETAQRIATGIRISLMPSPLVADFHLPTSKTPTRSCSGGIIRQILGWRRR